MAHRMTGLDAQHAMYAETPWHKLGNVGPIDWEEARRAFAWCEITKTPIYITHYGEQVMLPERNLLKMKYFPIAHAEVSDRYQIVQH